MIFKHFNIDKYVFIPTILIFSVVSAILIMGGSSLQGFLTVALAWITKQMGWAYMMIYIVNFIFFMWLLFSKYGAIRLGDPHSTPQYSNLQWGSMVFATAIDASILMLSIVDPIRYVSSPPFGIKPFSQNAYNYAHMLGQFDWGPMAWMMYAPAAIAIGYILFVKKGHVQRLSKSITFIQGDEKWKYALRQLVDFLVVFGIMGGVGSSVGMEIPIISNVLSSLTGLPDNMTLKIGLFGILFVIFAWTVWHGLNGGIDKLSDIHIWTAIIFLAFVLLVGPTIYILSSETNSLGLLTSNFVSLSTNTVPNGTPDIANSEVIFYWGWWLAYLPVMGLFIARISKGRTIRQILLGMLGYGSAGCLSFYAILGGYSLWLQKTGAINLVHILNTKGQEAVITAVLSSLPFRSIVFIVYCISSFIFLATTISSSAYIVSSFTSLKLKDNQEPSQFNRMTWVIIFVLFSFGIVVVGGFNTVETFCAISGFPLMFVCIMILVSIYHMVKNDEGIVLKAKGMDDMRIEKKKEKMQRIRAKRMAARLNRNIDDD
ncbi:BCCT family transporter [Fructilactobacillus sanfranciscensis]|nr:BCCT family transporter [Fructilactobacillus sanfranciscensis]MDN4461996.1 glycine/betaine ABC transporter [Fructilactobacillus sanfranciscensis]NDR61902.1 glycine/betaine ABC transporter [Fructilactobacillus sanfranciscensis]